MFIVGDRFCVSVLCAVSIEMSCQTVTPGSFLPKKPPLLRHGSAPSKAWRSSGIALPLSWSLTSSHAWPLASAIVVLRPGRSTDAAPPTERDYLSHSVGGTA